MLQWLGGVQTTLVLAAAMLAVALPTALSPAMHHAPPLGEARHEAVEPAGEQTFQPRPAAPASPRLSTREEGTPGHLSRCLTTRTRDTATMVSASSGNWCRLTCKRNGTGV